MQFFMIRFFFSSRRRHTIWTGDCSSDVCSSDLLGDQYVGIEPGGSPTFLKNGDEMVLTQSAMSIENLIGKFLVNGGPKSSGSDSAPASSAPPPSSSP